MERPSSIGVVRYPPQTPQLIKHNTDLKQHIDQQLVLASKIEDRNPKAQLCYSLKFDPRREAILIYRALGEKAKNLQDIGDHDGARQIDIALLELGIENQVLGNKVVAEQIYRSVNSGCKGLEQHNSEAGWRKFYADGWLVLSLGSKKAADEPGRKWAKYQYAILCFCKEGIPEDNNDHTALKYMNESAELGCELAKRSVELGAVGEKFFL
jgi:hypothetical protein